MEVGLVDRRTLKFQFLNTRKQETVWSQSFSEEIGCSFSVLRPPSPKPGKHKTKPNYSYEGPNRRYCKFLSECFSLSLLDSRIVKLFNTFKLRGD